MQLQNVIADEQPPKSAGLSREGVLLVLIIKHLIPRAAPDCPTCTTGITQVTSQ